MNVGDYVKIKDTAVIYPLDLKGSPNYGDIAIVTAVVSRSLFRVVKRGVKESDGSFLFTDKEVEMVNNRRMFS